MGRKIKVTVFITTTAIALYLGGFLASPPTDAVYGDGWWGVGEKPAGEGDASVREFEIRVADDVLADLSWRLNLTARLFEPLEDSPSLYHVDPEYVGDVVARYWKGGFDWRKQERLLNGFDHYMTVIEGIDVHFVHAKPKRDSGENARRPLLLVHGWPGSFFEFYKIIPMLTDPLNHGGSEDDAFEVICPSIPGFGFSEAPHKQGFDALAAARVFDKLMTRLGFDKFYIHGGDFGSIIGNYLSRIQPSHVLGFHTNTPFCLPSNYLIKMAIGSLFPTLVVDQEDVEYVFPLSGRAKRLFPMVSYTHFHMTRPDTPGFVLNDSPLGLASYVIEQFAMWTNSPHGDLEKHFTLDELLTNIMIYWVNENIGPSLRLYKETLPKALYEPTNCKVTVPMAIAAFKHELIRLPKTWARQIFPELVSYARLPRGGRFAALEEPTLLVEDIRKAVKQMMQRRNVSK